MEFVEKNNEKSIELKKIQFFLVVNKIISTIYVNVHLERSKKYTCPFFC